MKTSKLERQTLGNIKGKGKKNLEIKFEEKYSKLERY